MGREPSGHFWKELSDSEGRVNRTQGWELREEGQVRRVWDLSDLVVTFRGRQDGEDGGGVLRDCHCHPSGYSDELDQGELPRLVSGLGRFNFFFFFF